MSLILANNFLLLSGALRGNQIMETLSNHELRPGITNPQLWYPKRPAKSEWTRISKAVLEQDKNICQFCGHVATKYMNVHHVTDTSNTLENLISCGVTTTFIDIYDT